MLHTRSFRIPLYPRRTRIATGKSRTFSRNFPAPGDAAVGGGTFRSPLLLLLKWAKRRRFQLRIPAPGIVQGMGLAGSYFAWLAFLAAGTTLYAIIGRNAWSFQLQAQGMSPAEARAEAARLGQQIFPAGSVVDSLRISAGIWKTWALVAIYFTTFGGFIALTAWFPIYWNFCHSAPPVLAGSLTALYSILTSLFRVAGGFLSDRFGGERTAFAALVVLLIGAALMTRAPAFGICFSAEILMALGMGVANAAVFKLVAQEVPEAVGGAAGWVGGLGAFGGFAIPP